MISFHFHYLPSILACFLCFSEWQCDQQFHLSTTYVSLKVYTNNIMELVHFCVQFHGDYILELCKRIKITSVSVFVYVSVKMRMMSS